MGEQDKYTHGKNYEDTNKLSLTLYEKVKY